MSRRIMIVDDSRLAKVKMEELMNITKYDF